MLGLNCKIMLGLNSIFLFIKNLSLKVVKNKSSAIIFFRCIMNTVQAGCINVKMNHEIMSV